MPTLTSRLSCLVVVAAIATAADAQDLHIKKSITVGGNFISSTETSIKGARERTVSQSPGGSTITIRQCDLKRTITVNEQAQTYLVENDPQDDSAAKAAAMVSGIGQADAGGSITEMSTVTDLGDRKTIYGFPARHLKMKVTVQSSQNACSQVNQQYEVDGWYADISKDLAGACQQSLQPIHRKEGCSDRVIRRRTGSAKPGYPLTETVTLQSPDGSTSQIGMQTAEITKPVLEKELFDIPAEYHEVKSSDELAGTPNAQSIQASAASSSTQSLAGATANSAMQRPSPALMFNPAAQVAMQQQAMAMSQQMGANGGNLMGAGGMPSGVPNGMGTMGGNPGSAAPPPALLGPKAPGKIRIGVAPPDAQVGQGSNAGGDYSTPIRNAEITLMSGPAIEIAPLESHVETQVQAEAQQKQCDFIMYSSVVVKHPQSGGFGKFAKFGTMAASMSPMGAMSHGMAAAAAAQAAGMAASQMAQQQAMSQLAGFNGQVKSKDDVTVQYQLVATGKTSPVLQNTLQGKAKSDGEDVLTPLLQQTANAVLTQVSPK